MERKRGRMDGTVDLALAPRPSNGRGEVRAVRHGRRGAMVLRCDVVCALRRIVAPAAVAFLRQLCALSLMSGDRSEDIGVLIAELLQACAWVEALPTSRFKKSPALL